MKFQTFSKWKEAMIRLRWTNLRKNNECWLSMEQMLQISWGFLQMDYRFSPMEAGFNGAIHGSGIYLTDSCVMARSYSTDNVKNSILV
jgi:hypothetical protein